MPTINELGLTFNTPNYTGELLSITPADTPFLSAIGGLNGQGEVVTDTDFEGQVSDLDAPEQPEILEGADAPSLTNSTRGKWENTVQIFHYAFGISYTRDAATQRLSGLATGGQRNPVADELAFQTNQHLTTAARDMNFTFLNGVYQKPGTNAQARKTRGLLSAISTNRRSNLGAAIAATAAASTDAFTANGHGLSNGDRVRLSSPAGGLAGITAGLYFVRDASANTFKLANVAGGSAINVTADGTATIARLEALTRVALLDTMQALWDNHGINQSAEPTLIVNATMKRALSKVFITEAGYQETSRNVAGVAVTQIETDLGRVNIMLERAMPTHMIAVAHLALIKPAYLLIPDMGFLFVEALAKTGAQKKYQLYGEAGLWHGPEQAHALLEDVGAVAGA